MTRLYELWASPILPPPTHPALIFIQGFCHFIQYFKNSSDTAKGCVTGKYHRSTVRMSLRKGLV